VIKTSRIRWVEHVARIVDRRGTYKALGGRPDGKMPLGRRGRIRDDNIKMDFK
jgi:hypothetical protein